MSVLSTRVACSAALVLVLAGCATPPQPIAMPDWSSAPPDPECTSQRQCDAVMAKAAEWLPRVTGMRLQIASPTLYETYRPNGFGLLGGRAQLVPIDNEKSVVRVTIGGCYVSGPSCERDRFDATKNIRSILAGEAKLFALQAARGAP